MQPGHKVVMILFDEAMERVLDSCAPLGKTTLPIEKTIGYVLSDDILSPIDVSPFRNSAMDGFAVRAEWLSGATEPNPVCLPISSTIYAGDSTDSIENHKHGNVVRIMTGALLPDSFDSVVKREDVQSTDTEATFINSITNGENVREAGEDLQKGELVFSAGDIVRPWDVGLFAGIGMRELSVMRRPTAVIASTGDELVSPGKGLMPGQIYNSNAFAIRSLIEQFCGKLYHHTRVDDNESSLRQLFKSETDVIITTGGVSVGDKDMVVRIAGECGFTTIFHKVAIKPGKPFYFARRGKQLLFGLPGNPLSAAVTCAVFAIPALKKLSGTQDYKLARIDAKLDTGEARKTNRLLIWPGRITNDNRNGRMSVRYSPKKSSAALSALKHSDGLIFQSAPSDTETEPRITFLSWQQLLTI